MSGANKSTTPSTTSGSARRKKRRQARSKNLTDAFNSVGHAQAAGRFFLPVSPAKAQDDQKPTLPKPSFTEFESMFDVSLAERENALTAANIATVPLRFKHDFYQVMVEAIAEIKIDSPKESKNQISLQNLKSKLTTDKLEIFGEYVKSQSERGALVEIVLTRVESIAPLHNFIRGLASEEATLSCLRLFISLEVLVRFPNDIVKFMSTFEQQFKSHSLKQKGAHKSELNELFESVHGKLILKIFSECYRDDKNKIILLDCKPTSVKKSEESLGFISKEQCIDWILNAAIPKSDGPVSQAMRAGKDEVEARRKQGDFLEGPRVSYDSAIQIDVERFSQGVLSNEQKFIECLSKVIRENVEQVNCFVQTCAARTFKALDDYYDQYSSEVKHMILGKCKQTILSPRNLAGE